jgi:hypothetical protein
MTDYQWSHRLPRHQCMQLWNRYQTCRQRFHAFGSNFIATKIQWCQLRNRYQTFRQRFHAFVSNSIVPKIQWCQLWIDTKHSDNGLMPSSPIPLLWRLLSRFSDVNCGTDTKHSDNGFMPLSWPLLAPFHRYHTHLSQQRTVLECPVNVPIHCWVEISQNFIVLLAHPDNRVKFLTHRFRDETVIFFSWKSLSKSNIQRL